MERLKNLRDKLQKGIKHIFGDSIINGDLENRLPNALNVSLPGFRGESIVLELDKKGIFFSSGSACSAGSPKPSHALVAMGLSENQAHNSLRFSLGMGNSEEDVDYTLEKLDEVVRKSKNIIQFNPCR